MISKPDDHFSEAVQQALAMPDLLLSVRRISREVDRAIAALNPKCELSGRCCRFDEYGHRLYITTVEFADFVYSVNRDHAMVGLYRMDDNCGCGFQNGKLCMAHRFRPTGCRLFYCDPRHENALQELYEKTHGQLRLLHQEFSIPYFYVEWRSALELLPQLCSLSTGKIHCPSHDTTND